MGGIGSVVSSRLFISLSAVLVEAILSCVHALVHSLHDRCKPREKEKDFDGFRLGWLGLGWVGMDWVELGWISHEPSIVFLGSQEPGTFSFGFTGATDLFSGFT